MRRHFGAQLGIARLERRVSPWFSSAPIEELDVGLSDGATLRLVFKDLSQERLLVDARRARPSFLHNPRREIEVYRAILAPCGLDTATYYGAVLAPDSGRYWLFLENVPGVHLWQVGELDVWQHVARWLAAAHGRFEVEVELLTRAATLLCYDSDFYRLWLRRARAFAGSADSSAVRRIEWLSPRYERVIERLTALPATIVHGDFWASNVLVQETPGAPRVCPIDWELAGVGPGLIDLAGLTAGGGFTEAEKAAVVLAYYAALESSAIRRSPLDEFLQSLDSCRLFLAVRMLGWSADWSPPLEHAHDWLGEALQLAEQLAL